MGMACSQSHLPVPITQVPELGANDAGQEGPDSAPGNEGLCNCPNPEVNIVRCPIQDHELLGQFTIAQHLRELIHCLRLGEPTEAPPGVVTCNNGDRSCSEPLPSTCLPTVRAKQTPQPSAASSYGTKGSGRHS